MRVRPATPADADLLLAWRNDPETVAWSRSPDPVDRPSHLRWLDGVLADPARRLLIAESDGPVGTVRFDRDGDAWEVSITVAPERRGQGLAVPMLACAEATLETGASLVAWVHAGNAASLALFERAGYRSDSAHDDWVRWVKRLAVFDYDAELRRYATRLTSAVHIGPSDDVLDIGCGAGQTTREAASVARSALGVDISPAMVARARALAVGANIRFELADAAVFPFAPNSFTLAISRFGTMFFDDPVAAFTNIKRALAPGAPLVQLVWQAASEQEWVREIRGALGPSDAGDSAFSLADPSTVENVLSAAGFTEVSLTEVAEPVWYGPDPASAIEAARALRMVGAQADRLHDVMTAHAKDDGVWFDSRAWLVRAISS